MVNFNQLHEADNLVDESEAICLLESHDVYGAVVSSYDSYIGSEAIFDSEGKYIAKKTKSGQFYSHEIMFYLE
jgi:hypothetical protein